MWETVVLYPVLLWGYRITSLCYPERQRNEGDPRYKQLQVHQLLWSGDLVRCALSQGCEIRNKTNGSLTTNTTGSAHQEPTPMPLDRYYMKESKA